MEIDEDIKEKISASRWKIRRRFAVVSFVELVTLPFWAGPVIEGLKTPQDLIQASIWAAVAIISAYIGGVVIDDNWKK